MISVQRNAKSPIKILVSSCDFNLFYNLLFAYLVIFVLLFLTSSSCIEALLDLGVSQIRYNLSDYSIPLTKGLQNKPPL